MSAMSGFIEFHFGLTNCFPADRAVYSDVVSAGGHDWRASCFPNDGDFASLYLELMTEAQNVTAVFDAAVLIDSDELMRRRTVHVYNHPRVEMEGTFALRGFPRFIHKSDLALGAVRSSHVRIMWAVVVVDDDGSGEPVSIHSIADVPEPLLPTTRKRTIAVPSSDMIGYLRRMLDSAALTDVSFVLDDGHGGHAPPVHAHRAFLAARSPVLEAALCGHVLEANEPITVPNMDPKTFKAMLRYIYTDSLPTGVNDEEALQSLLAAADRYALGRLKLLCAKRLLDNVSVDTVTGVLDCAETYNCPELKTKCIDYVDENFKKVALTDGFMDLMARSPSILAEMRKRQSECQEEEI